MKSKKTDMVIGAYISNNGKILLVHHKELGKWLPPGGNIEANETPDEAVLREVREETGIDKLEFVHRAEVEKDKNIVAQLPLPFYANVHNVGDHNHACLFYLCRTKSSIVSLSAESTEYRWVSPAEMADSIDIPSDVKKIGMLVFEKAKQECRN